MGKETSSSIKKKRKINAESSEQDVDVYKKVVEFEEKESHIRSSSVDAQLFFQSCSSIREILLEIYKQKASKDSNKRVKDRQIEIYMVLCLIKKLNRIDKIRNVVGRELLTVEKQKCDSIKLSYQNLVYELHHLVSETNKCLAFKSKDEEIQLVSFEEFMREAPDSLTKKFEKYDSENQGQVHSLRLARLEFELSQRKNLAQLYKSLVEEQQKLGKDLVERKKQLNALRPFLQSIITATKPLQAHLDFSSNELLAENKRALLLPDQLYIFYINAVSYNNVYESNLNVLILGDEDEASQWKDSNGISDIVIQNDDESDQETETQESEEMPEVKKRRHRKSTQQVDPMEEKKKKILEVHPLAVEITAKLENGPSVTLTFQYRTKLKIVTVTSRSSIPPNITVYSDLNTYGNPRCPYSKAELIFRDFPKELIIALTQSCAAFKSLRHASTASEILSGENILTELIENDFGKDSPNPLTPYQLERCGINSYQSLVPQIGYAYHWAQRVCGMDFLTKQMNSEQIRRANVENIVKLLLKRLHTRYDLATQLQQLEQNTIPKIPDSGSLPTNRVSSLIKWSACTYQEFCQTECTHYLVDEEIPSPSDFFYSAIFDRGSAQLQALILIKNNYPDELPIFSLCLQFKGEIFHAQNNDDIRDMERMVNFFSKTEVKPSWILSVQITHLCSIFDVYLETLDPKSFPQNTTFLKSICGRNRRRPFNFKKVGSGIFTQY